MTDNWNNDWWNSTDDIDDNSRALDLPEDADFREDISWHGSPLPDTQPAATQPPAAQPAPKPAPAPQPPLAQPFTYAQPPTAQPPAQPTPSPTWDSYQASPYSAQTPTPAVYRPSTPATRRRQRGSAVVGIAVAVAVAAGVFATNSSFDDGGDEPPPMQWDAATSPLSDSLVEIDVSASDADGQGTGLVVDDNTVVTPYHLIFGATSIKVTSTDGTQAKATVLGFDATKDIAVLKADLPDIEPVDTSMGMVAEDDPVTIADATTYDNPIQADSAVNAIEEQIEIYDYLFTNSVLTKPSELLKIGIVSPDGLSRPGMNAAGPGASVFDDSGQFVGMVLEIDDDAYAVQADDINKVVSTVQAGKDRGTVRVGPAGDLGFSVVDAADQDDDIENTYPVIGSVTRNGPAAKAGIAKNDTLVAINGTDLNDDQTLGAEGIIRSLEPGSKAKITIRPAKGASEKTYTLTVAKSDSA